VDVNHNETTRSRRAHKAAAVALVLAAVLAACRETPVHDEGAARRIVSLSPAATEILFALDAGDRLVGVCSFCDHPPAVAAIPRIGSFTTPSVEAIVAARPDLVIAVHGPATHDAVEAVERAGLPVLVLEDTTLAAVWRAIAEIGRRTGREAAAQALAADLRARFAAVRARVAGAPRRRVLVVVGQTPLVVAGVGTFVDDLVREAGGENIAADTGLPWPRLGLETVVARAPEVIIDSAISHEGGADPGLWKRFPALPAVREGRVYGYRSFAALRGGPRLADAAEEFARLIHPERFADQGGASASAAAGP
jgi:iron complex transport system substrate-binding protein